jgi:cytochrome b
LLVLGLAAGASGWLIYEDIGGEWLGELHEGLAATMLTIAALHVAGVAASSLAHRENLVRAMITGWKRGRPEDAIAGAKPLAAIAMLGWVAACAWWLAR